MLIAPHFLQCNNGFVTDEFQFSEAGKLKVVWQIIQ